MSEEIGTNNYKIMINKKWFVRFEEINNKKGIGSYSNCQFTTLNAIPSTDEIIVSENENEAYLILGKMNLKSLLNKMLSDYNYKFYSIEIYEQGE